MAVDDLSLDAAELAAAERRLALRAEGIDPGPCVLTDEEMVESTRLAEEYDRRLAQRPDEHPYPVESFTVDRATGRVTGVTLRGHFPTLQRVQIHAPDRVPRATPREHRPRRRRNSGGCRSPGGLDPDLDEPPLGGSPSLTPLQTWQAAQNDLLADARAELDDRAFGVFLDLILTRAARELAELDAEAWSRAA